MSIKDTIMLLLLSNISSQGCQHLLTARHSTHLKIKYPKIVPFLLPTAKTMLQYLTAPNKMRLFT